MANSDSYRKNEIYKKSGKLPLPPLPKLPNGSGEPVRGDFRQHLKGGSTAAPACPDRCLLLPSTGTATMEAGSRMTRVELADGKR